MNRLNASISQAPVVVERSACTTPEESPLFTRWVDPVSKVESWILSQRVATIQQSFYFTNPSFTNDGRFLWFFCAFPPGGDAYYGRQLGVVDFLRSEVHHFPETQFTDASPGVNLETGEVHWTTGLELWKRGPRPEDVAELVNAFPNELANNRRPLRLATHLTFSADRRSANIDAQIGSDWFVGDLPLDGGPFRLWQKFDRCYNHAQFSPTDPDVQLLAQDGWHDPTSGAKGEGQDRLWIIRRGEKARPLCPNEPATPGQRGHEWWDADGQHVWYIDYRSGTERVNIHTGRRENIWPRGHSHSHCDLTGSYLVGDASSAGNHWRVSFFNRQTGKEIDVVSSLPAIARARYHVHPHPQFCLGDRYICYTTNVRGSVDLAMVSVDQLVSATR